MITGEGQQLIASKRMDGTGVRGWRECCVKHHISTVHCFIWYRAVIIPPNLVAHRHFLICHIPLYRNRALSRPCMRECKVNYDRDPFIKIEILSFHAFSSLSSKAKWERTAVFSTSVLECSIKPSLMPWMIALPRSSSSSSETQPWASVPINSFISSNSCSLSCSSK